MTPRFRVLMGCAWLAVSGCDGDTPMPLDGGLLDGAAPTADADPSAADADPHTPDAAPPPDASVGGPTCEAIAPARCYYVAKTGDDDADGSHDAPLRHIWRGIDLAGPGDFIYVRGGTWTQSEEATALHCGDGDTRLAIVPILTTSLYGTGASGESCTATWPAITVADGEPGAPITLSAYGGESVVLDSEGGDLERPSPIILAQFGNFPTYVSHWVLRGFELRGGIVYVGGGASELGNSHHLIIEGNEIHGVTSDGGGNVGLIKIDRGDVGGPYEITIRGNHLHDLRDNGATGWIDTGDAQHFGAVTTLSREIYLGVAGGGTGRIVIEDNLIHDVPQAFFFKNPAAGPLEIRRNRIHRSQRLGIAASSNLIFEGNLVYDVPGGFVFGWDPTSDAPLLALSGQNAVLRDNTIIGGELGSCRTGGGHVIEGNLVFGARGRVAGAGWDTSSLLSKSEIPPDPDSVGASLLHTITMDGNCYASPHADFQLVARYTASDVEHYDLAAARSTFDFDLTSVFVQTGDAATVFMNAAAHDYRQVASSPCAGYGADVGTLP